MIAAVTVARPATVDATRKAAVPFASLTALGRSTEADTPASRSSTGCPAIGFPWASASVTTTVC